MTTLAGAAIAARYINPHDPFLTIMVIGIYVMIGGLVVWIASDVIRGKM